MDGYSKLFGRILDSTVWREDDPTRILWITMLAMVNQDGFVYAPVPGLADRARISLENCERGLLRLQEPDPYSSSKTEDGRRIRVVDGGWFLVNHAKYRALMSAEDRREKARLRQQKVRLSRSVTHGHSLSRMSRHTEADTDTEAKADTKDQDQRQSAAPEKSATPQVLHPMQYAVHICDELVIPKKGNMETVAGAIEALAKSRKTLPCEAHDYLLAKALAAKEAGEIVNLFWFRDGKYNITRKLDDDHKTSAQRRNERNSELIERVFREAETAENLSSHVRKGTHGG